MRHPDVEIDGTTRVWHVPMQPVKDWVAENPGNIPREYERDGFDRATMFALVWRDLWYMSLFTSGGDIDDEPANRTWLAVSLRDLRPLPHYPRMYPEVNWELRVSELKREEPPVNGEALYTELGAMPWFIYQFHGLPERAVMNVGNGETFAIFGWQVCARGKRPIPEVMALLSLEVNKLRVEHGMPELVINRGDPVLTEFSLDPRAGLLTTHEKVTV